MGDGNSETLGQVLRRSREARGLTVQQIAATTRIPVRNLEALERDDLGLAPGEFYLRAEVLAYADAAGLGRAVALELLHAATEPPIVPDAATPARVAPPSRPVARWSALAVVCLIVAALAIWRPSRDAAPTPLPSAVPPPPIVDRPTATASAGTAGFTDGVAQSTDAAPASHDTATPAAGSELEIASEPEGARVTIDGVGWGVTPLTVKYLSPGTKQLRVTLEGFASQELMVRVPGKAAQTSVHVELQQNDEPVVD